MTQEVQPLTWQKRTNLEEHQQFFSKINEIIANLAPTVDKAEAAIATANAASASADAASQQAQTAADTVAGYDARMAAVESKNSQQDTAISALQTADAQDVKLTGDQNITGIKTVPTEATGSHSQQIANSLKIGAELDNYAFMLRTSDNQVFSGIKKAGPAGFIRKSSATMSLTSPPAGTVNDETYVLEDINGQTVVSNFNSFTPNAQTIYQMSTKYPFEEDGVIKTVVGYIWLAVYNDRAVLFLRYTDKNGVSHLKEISRVSETDP